MIHVTYLFVVIVLSLLVHKKNKQKLNNLKLYKFKMNSYVKEVVKRIINIELGIEEIPPNWEWSINNGSILYNKVQEYQNELNEELELNYECIMSRMNVRFKRINAITTHVSVIMTYMIEQNTLMKNLQNIDYVNQILSQNGNNHEIIKNILMRKIHTNEVTVNNLKIILEKLN